MRLHRKARAANVFSDSTIRRDSVVREEAADRIIDFIGHGRLGRHYTMDQLRGGAMSKEFSGEQYTELVDEARRKLAGWTFDELGDDDRLGEDMVEELFDELLSREENETIAASALSDAAYEATHDAARILRNQWLSRLEDA